MISNGMRRTLIWAAVVAVFCLLTMPQASVAQGESAVPFLLLAPNARADAMGEAGGALSDDAASAFWNPAGLAFLLGQEVSITHSNLLPQFQQSDLFYDYLAYRNHIADIGGTISATLTYESLGEFVETDASGPTPISTFRAYEFGITAGYATRILSDLGVGLNLRYIRSVLAPFNVQGQGRQGIASTISFDVATLWKPAMFDNRLGVGVNLSNLGPKLTYIDEAQADPLPTNLRLSFAGQVFKSEYNNINVVLDFTRILVRRRPEIVDSATQLVVQEASVDKLPKALFSAWGDGGIKKVDIGTGLEYWYGSPRLIAIRFGYFYENPNYGNRKFLTYGAGVRYDVYGFDFSYLSAVEENHPLDGTLRFSLLIAWGGNKE
ncbi:MAG TPA: PorV/PorQ family protein [Bacteroidota bacterium]|nr:PorV/PorQ family protein [Bacteroidota bacterium]